jgi:hypothetical protein
MFCNSLNGNSIEPSAHLQLHDKVSICESEDDIEFNCCLIISAIKQDEQMLCEHLLKDVMLLSIIS